jgi:multidrug resistance efflux pump
MKKELLYICVLFLITAIFSCQNVKKPDNNNQKNGSNFNQNRFIELFGTVKAENIKNIYLNFDAEINKIHVKQRQKIKKGDKLITFSYLGFDNQIREKEYDILNEQFELKKLLLDNYDKTSQRYILQEKKIDNIKADLSELHEMKTLKNIIGNTMISDIDNGVIYDIGYNEGDFFSENDKSSSRILLTIYDMDSLKVIADIPEEFFKDVKVGQKVIINPVSDRNKNYNGIIDRIYDVAYNKDGETVVLAEITIKNMDRLLLPNFNVDVRIDL